MNADEQIKRISDTWSKLVSVFQEKDVNLMSQSLLKDMRHLCEAVICKVCFPSNNDYNYEMIKRALNTVRKIKDKRFLLEWHECLQSAVSHYCVDENNSPYLMCRYLPYILRIKKMLADEYGIVCFSDITSELLKYGDELEAYYNNIAQVLYSAEEICEAEEVYQTMYLISQKAIYVHDKLLYELTLVPAGIHLSKAEGIIVYSKYNVHTRYGVRVALARCEVLQSAMYMPVILLCRYTLSIQPAELNVFAKIMGNDLRISRKNIEYRNLMDILQKTRYNLYYLLKGSDKLFSLFEEKMLMNVSRARLVPIFRKARALLMSNSPGVNVLSYLLYTFNYSIMYDQLGSDSLSYMSNLCLDKKCYAFEKMPFCSSLTNHNSRLEDVFMCVNAEGRECQLLAKRIEYNTEKNGALFTDVEELLKYKKKSEIDELVNLFNSSLYVRHEYRRIEWYKNRFLYIKGFADKTAYIV